MADPQKYTRDYSFTDYQASNPSAPLPGIQVDAELEDVEASIGEIVDALKDVRRSDGALKNGIVTVDSLDAQLQAGVGAGALASADAAQTARDFAHQWSSAASGVDVDDGVNPVNKSAYHWAQVALGAASGALPDGSVTEQKLAVDVASKLNGATQAAVYDPSGVEADAFDRLNHRGAGLFMLPQGRLSLQSGVAVMAANYSGASASTLFYIPHVGDAIPLWDGSRFSLRQFSEMSLPLSATYHLAATNYDVYVMDDAGTLRLGTGPAWAGANSRGTGAGTAEIETQSGVRVNKNPMTIRWGGASGETVSVDAREATLVGSVRAVAAGQTEWTPAPTAVDGGSDNKLFLWNAYNQQAISAVERERTDVWTYGTNTFRALNNSIGNRISFLCGDASASVEATLSIILGTGTAGSYPIVAIALDSTSVPASNVVGFRSQAVNENASVHCEVSVTAGLGLHYVQAIEKSLTGISGQFLGEAGGDQFQKLTACILM